MQKVLITGSSGFIGGYIVEELLGKGYRVVGLDNLSKYGPVSRSFDTNPNYEFINGDARDASLLIELLDGCDHFIAGAAMVGGIGYFNELPYDLLATNERITAASCDAAIEIRRRGGPLRKVTYISSSMVYETTSRWPSVEGDEAVIPPPKTIYGFQKLAVEYFAKAAYTQYNLPYTILRPFNCVGLGEGSSKDLARNLKINEAVASSHVVPDLIEKVLSGQRKLHILGDGKQIRHFTFGGDIARAVVMSLNNDACENETLNISSTESTCILDLATTIWHKINGDNQQFEFICDEPYPYDVEKRIPSVEKARRLLGFEATASLDEVLDQVISWMRQNRESL